MITSGILLHMCVGAMLIIRPNSQKITERINCNNKLNITDEGIRSNTKCNGSIEMKNNDSAKHMTVTVLSHIRFILLLINGSMFLFGTGVVFTHIMAFAESQDISHSLGNLMISVLGLSSLIGRIILSLFSQHPLINTKELYIVAEFLSSQFYCEQAILLTQPTGLIIAVTGQSISCQTLPMFWSAKIYHGTFWQWKLFVKCTKSML